MEGVHESIFDLNSRSLARKAEEVISDKSQEAVYVIDNSGSMGYYHDGKSFSLEADGTIKSQSHILRWAEARSKTLQIAEYNIRRRIRATYYLLNPYSNSYVNSTDYVLIDPNVNDNAHNNRNMERLLAPLKTLLLDRNVRGSTPLDRVTDHFARSLRRTLSSRVHQRAPICYNIITDGEPNSKSRFETSLRNLASTSSHPLFITINLCTDDDAVVDYYNNLDRMLGNEVSGLDVIDDLVSEQAEVINAGNNFFTYGHDVHVCRMAGCYSVVADLMDETVFLPHHANKLIKELLKPENPLPDWHDSDAYVNAVRSLAEQRPQVYDFRRRRFCPIVDADKVRWMMWRQDARANMSRHKFSIIAVVVLLMALLFTVNPSSSPVGFHSNGLPQKPWTTGSHSHHIGDRSSSSHHIYRDEGSSEHDDYDYHRQRRHNHHDHRHGHRDHAHERHGDRHGHRNSKPSRR